VSLYIALLDGTRRIRRPKELVHDVSKLELIAPSLGDASGFIECCKFPPIFDVGVVKHFAFKLGDDVHVFPWHACHWNAARRDAHALKMSPVKRVQGSDALVQKGLNFITGRRLPGLHAFAIGAV